MLEPPRVGLPNIVGQGELVARTRGAQAGAAESARHTIAASLQQEAVRKAEALPPADRVERVDKDPQEAHDHHRRGHDARHEDDLEDLGDDGDGHLLDVVA